MRREGFLARCLRGRCCTQSADVLALVWSSVLHAPRRHCLEALYKTQDKLEMRQMDIAKDMRTTKRLLEENWQNDSSLIEQSRNASLPEYNYKQKMSLCRVWRIRWHRARDVGAISEHGQMIQQEAPNVAELDWEVSQLQPGERRRGISASQSTIGCCLNSTILEQFVTMRAAQA